MAVFVHTLANVIALHSLALRFPTLPPRPRHAAPLLSAATIREAKGGEKFAAAQVLAEAFNGLALYYLTSLQAPALESNVFFKPIDSPMIAVATAADGTVSGVAQLIRVKLSGMATSQPRPAAAFVQNVAVARSARRQGIARDLMSYVEQRACEWEDVDEAWLAVAVDNAPALALYESLGYQRLGERMGNVLMRKGLTAGTSRRAAADPSLPSGSAPTYGAQAAVAAPTGLKAPVHGAGSREQPLPVWSFGGLVSGLANALAKPLESALELVLEAGFPGQLELVARAEQLLRQDARVVALLGEDVAIGEVDAKESMAVSAGVQMLAVVTGSKGSGRVTVGGARQDEEGRAAGKPLLSLEVLRVQVGGEEFYVVEP